MAALGGRALVAGIAGFSINMLLGVVYSWSVFVGSLEAQFAWVRTDTSMVFSISMVMLCAGQLVSGWLIARTGGSRLRFHRCRQWPGMGLRLLWSCVRPVRGAGRQLRARHGAAVVSRVSRHCLGAAAGGSGVGNFRARSGRCGCSGNLGLANRLCRARRRLRGFSRFRSCGSAPSAPRGALRGSRRSAGGRRRRSVDTVWRYDTTGYGRISCLLDVLRLDGAYQHGRHGSGQQRRAGGSRGA